MWERCLVCRHLSTSIGHVLQCWIKQKLQKHNSVSISIIANKTIMLLSLIISWEFSSVFTKSAPHFSFKNYLSLKLYRSTFKRFSIKFINWGITSPPTPLAQSRPRCFTSFHPKNEAALSKYELKFYQYFRLIYSLSKSIAFLLDFWFYLFIKKINYIGFRSTIIL